MSDQNPYDTKDTTAYYVGHDRLLRQIFTGFRGGKSFAVLGGPRCGKTSLLKKIQSSLNRWDIDPFSPIPCYLNPCDCEGESPGVLFQRLYEGLTHGTGAPEWDSTEKEGDDYEKLTSLISSAAPFIEKKYGEKMAGCPADRQLRKLFRADARLQVLRQLGEFA